uniref:Uncharacterized protein n=1 Tax=Anguilla anguilla TaxID=7936 RepID=A0A0E9X8E4_ANGAN
MYVTIVNQETSALQLLMLYTSWTTSPPCVQSALLGTMRFDYPVLNVQLVFFTSVMRMPPVFLQLCPF